MLSKTFLGMSLLGAEWVLYVLLLLSVLSVALILQRLWFYRSASKGLLEFRMQIRKAIDLKKYDEALKLAEARENTLLAKDFESELVIELLKNRAGAKSEALMEIAQDTLLRTKIEWERNLVTLATIGNNAPFVGLFGTVLGIIQAFHHLSEQASTGMQMVTSGISEALVATAIGILVAIPAVAAYNFFQRRVKSATAEAEALKSYIIGKLSL
jgi:biopolymer transport protein ExbB/TolQ